MGVLNFDSYYTLREYGEYTLKEIGNRKIAFCLGAFLLLGQLTVLFMEGKYWFCADTIRGRGDITAFLLPGLGYAHLCYAFAINDSLFSSSREKFMESVTTILGIILILIGYWSIFLHRLSLS